MSVLGFWRSIFEGTSKSKAPPPSPARSKPPEQKEELPPVQIKICDPQSKVEPTTPLSKSSEKHLLPPSSTNIPPNSPSLTSASTSCENLVCSIKEIPFGVHTKSDQLTSEFFKVVVAPDQPKTLCTFWLSNPGEFDLVIDCMVTREIGDSIFTILAPKQIILAAGTSQQFADNEILLQCNIALIQLEASADLTFAFKHQGAEEVSHFKLHVLAKGFSAAENLQYTTVPLRYMPDKWHLVAEDVVNPEKKELVEMTLGLHCSLAFLSRLYLDLDHIAGWSDVKDKVMVSLIKDTSDCGNSSVSMGLAWIYFKKYKSEAFVVFLNCGSGGVKLQVYHRVSKTVIVLFEHKPGEGSVSNITGVGDYRPQQKKQDLEEVKAEFEDALQTFHRWKTRIETAQKRMDSSGWSQKKPFAFVTGDIRNHWEKATEDMKQEMEHKLTALFGAGEQSLADPVTELLSEDSGNQQNHGCFFVTQHDEGRMESVGVRAMLKTVDKQLHQGNPDSKGRVDPVAILGIGTGSSRLTTLLSKRIGQTKRREFVVIPHEAGMPNTLKLLQLGSCLISDQRISKLVEACLDADRAGRTPVIGLKSGALIRLWEKENTLERKALTEAPTLDYFKVRGPNKKSRAVILSTTTLSRFASESIKEDKSEIDYLVARKEGEKVKAGAFGHMAVEFMRPPPKLEQKPNTCYIGPTDHIVWEGIPSHVWWWPWKDKTERDSRDPCDAYLLMRLPFVLLKDFLPTTPKETKATEETKETEEAKETKASKGSKGSKGSKEPKDTVVTRFEHLFKTFLGHEATLPATGYECICRVYRMLYEAREIPPNDANLVARAAVLLASQTPKYDKDEKAEFQQSRAFVAKELTQPAGIAIPIDKDWRALSHKDHLKWLHPTAEFCQGSPSVEQNTRKAWFLLEPFKRSLQAVCDSRHLCDFSDLHCVANVKSQEGLRRKIAEMEKEYHRKIEENEAKGIKEEGILLEGPQNIYDYLRGTIYVGKGRHPVQRQVKEILDAIATLVAPIHRIKWYHCEKGKGFIIVNVLFKVESTCLLSEVQIRLPSKKSSSSPPDDHLKHEAARSFGRYLAQTMSFGTAVATFFSLPCKHPFREFGKDEKITVQELEGGEIEVIRSESEPSVQPQPQPVSASSQWSAIIDQFVGVLQDLTTDQQADHLQCPVYVNKDQQVQFYAGVREGVKLVLAALGNTTHFKLTATAEFVYNVPIFRWLADQLKLTVDAGDVFDQLVAKLISIKDVGVMGQVAAWRFCCRNPFLYKTLKEEKTVWTEVFNQDKPKARTFGVLAALFRVGDVVHTAWLGEVAVRYLPSVYIIGAMGQSPSVDFAAAMARVKTHNAQRKELKQTRVSASSQSGAVDVPRRSSITGATENTSESKT